MKIEFDKSFERSLSKYDNPILFQRLKRIIHQLERAPSLAQVSNIKKLSGYPNYYRIRIGDYRIGIEAINKTTVRLIIIAHRKDIYKVFP